MTATIYCDCLEEYIQLLIQRELLDEHKDDIIRLRKKFRVNRRGRPKKLKIE